MAQAVWNEMFLEILGGSRMTFSGAVSTDESNMRTYEVADETTDESVDLGGITTVDVFAITSDYQITYKLNGSATAITLDAKKSHVLFGTSITAITISNASGSTASVQILIAGT